MRSSPGRTRSTSPARLMARSISSSPPARRSPCLRAGAAKDSGIATGSSVRPLPGVEIDQERIVDSTGALELAKVPGHLVVIGGGVIGLELGSVWRRLGAKVTVVELTPTILPGSDADVIKEPDRVFRRQGLELKTGTRVTGGSVTGNGVTL